MHLYVVPLIFVLIGLTLYTVLAGADFGAGMWQLTAGPGEHGEQIRDHAHHSIGPVWEANHVWLIFVITVFWTCYPVAFGSIASTLEVPLFLAGIGIVLRGATYALRSGARTSREIRRIDTLFALSSVLAPFALGSSIGAIAAGRVPVGNAAGHLFSSWLNPTAIAVGVIAVLSSAYLAAVYLAADAQRLHRPALVEAFRRRALVAGILAGAAAVGGLIVIHGNDHPLYHHLTGGGGMPAMIVSFAAGLTALALVAGRHFNPARYAAALATAAVVAGWALAQQPLLLPGLTIARAAAPHDTLVLTTVAVLTGAVLLFPSLGLLFRLFLTGRLGEPAQMPEPAHMPEPAQMPEPVQVQHPAGERRLARTRRWPSPSATGRIALACFVTGLGLVVFVDAWWGQAIGVVALFACVLIGFAAVAPPALADRRLD